MTCTLVHVVDLANVKIYMYQCTCTWEGVKVSLQWSTSDNYGANDKCVPNRWKDSLEEQTQWNVTIDIVWDQLLVVLQKLYTADH